MSKQGTAAPAPSISMLTGRNLPAPPPPPTISLPSSRNASASHSRNRSRTDLHEQMTTYGDTLTVPTGTMSLPMKSSPMSAPRPTPPSGPPPNAPLPVPTKTTSSAASNAGSANNSQPDMPSRLSYGKSDTQERPELSADLSGIFPQTPAEELLTRTFDVIVIGLGAMGASALYHLSKLGVSVLGLERFEYCGHALGSSHGESRIIRKAYFEHPSYVPFLDRSYELWHDLEDETGEQVLIYTGGLDIGRPDSEMVRGSLKACEQHSIENSILTPDEVAKRFPGFTIPDEYVAVYQAEAGVLEPEKAVQCEFQMASVFGAEALFHEHVTDIALSEDQTLTLVHSTSGVFKARHVVLCAGPWIKDFVKTSSVFTDKNTMIPPGLFRGIETLVVERQVVTWYRPPTPNLYSVEYMPIVLCQLDPRDVQRPPRDTRSPTEDIAKPSAFYYSFPLIPHGDVLGLKMGRYNHLLEEQAPDELSREVTARDVRTQLPFLEKFFKPLYDPQFAQDCIWDINATPANLINSQACMFTNTEDGHFIIDNFPLTKKSEEALRNGRDPFENGPSLTFISACSGHGFKFSSAIGQAAADLTVGGRYSRPDLEWLRVDRFVNKAANWHLYTDKFRL